MYHSITFGDKNTWEDWHLVPSSRPVFNPPSLKRKILEIPGADGSIDLTESLTGYPVYDNREGSIELIVMNGYAEWYQIYSDIMDYLHGQTMRAILEDDKEYFYEGCFTVNEWKSNQDYSRIVIDYSVGPYKWYILKSLENWRWDDFNFHTGVILSTNFKDIAITTDYAEHIFTRSLFGRAPVCPSFVVDTATEEGAYIRFVNPKLGIDAIQQVSDGTTQLPEFLFIGDTVTIYLKSVSGTGTVSIDFRQGRL